LPASAQATRTWVSGLGDDANPCSRTAPCKTFAGAYSRTAVGGEIDVIDPGGYGTISISHALTIDGGGMFASILSAGTNGVNINAGASDVVTLKRLAINGVLGYISPGINGINFNSGLLLNLVDDTLENFNGVAVNFTPSGSSYLNMTNCDVRYANGGGLLVAPTGSGSGNADVVRSRFTASSFGVKIGVNSHASVLDSSSDGNGDAGFLAASGGLISLQNVTSVNNSTGIHAQNGGTIRYAQTTIMGNGTGITTDAGGATVSWKTNRALGNVIEGAPSLTIVEN
jgi:hypothetical protein